MSDKPTPINVSAALDFIKLAKFVPDWASSVAFDKSKRIGRIKLRLKMRRAGGVMGRFGGGWNWKLGIQIGGETLLISLLVAELTISIIAKALKRQCQICELQAELTAALQRAEKAEAERDAMREDAERYRWLRGDTTDYSVLCEQGLCGEVMDSAIDAARKETL